jgi:tetratricopeptide (TPR) repeat protein
LKALEEREGYVLEMATTLDLLGFIRLAKRNAEAARDNLQEALKLRLKHLNQINPNHPDIGISYRNLGRLDSRLSFYIDAQNNYLRAEQIFRQNYPESHSLIKEITQCLKDVKHKLEH